ncbi:MAG TPA: biopolymer transporter ExbD [Methylophilaceae bacterium]|nr:biopolymer transporter ExbD [Methylophilaceae bacterium]HQR60631.1 biopolymer transporter ExbD [Methylophilaceae bacterium]
MAIVSNENGMMSDINVTPLVDVMLVLLTVFIVTAPLLMNAVSVKLPKAAATTAISKINSVRISITEDGKLYVDQNLVRGSLEAELRRMRGQGEFSVEILGDEKVPYGYVARAMAQVQRAGISKFAFVMLPEKPQAAKQ